MPEDRVPDAKTIWLFREQLTQHNLIKELFYEFELQLQRQGFKACKGQIIDASLVDAPKQRNSREEITQIKAGETPYRFEDNPNVTRQKDTDAPWVKKNDESSYAYKNHISADVEHKLIREYDVSSAEVRDSQRLFDVLSENTDPGVWADYAYWSEAHELILGAMGYASHIHEKGTRDNLLTAKQQASNKKKSSIRVRVEHVFGSIANEQKGGFVRVRGLARAATKIGLTNLVYNM
jgi:IS5 family transposase